MLGIDNWIIADVDGRDAVFIEDLACFFGADVGFDFVVHLVGEEGSGWRTGPVGAFEDLRVLVCVHAKKAH